MGQSEKERSAGNKSKRKRQTHRQSKRDRVDEIALLERSKSHELKNTSSFRS